MKTKGDKSVYLLSLLASIGLSLLIGGLLMAVSGHNPFTGYEAMLRGVFGNGRVLGNTAAKAMQLCLTGLAMTVAAKAGMFNVGGEGQLYLGAMAAAVTGIFLTGAAKPAAVLLSAAAAAAAGGVCALAPAWLRVRLGISEVITTIMLNSAVIYFCKWLVNGPVRTDEPGVLSGSPNVYACQFAKLIRASNLTTAFLYGAAIAVLVWYVLEKTTVGLELRLTGENQRFAFFIGLPKDRLMIWSMVISGAICGLVGMFEVYGVHGRYVENISSGFYFDGMLLAMIMNYSPAGVILASFFFAVLKTGAPDMELATGVSAEISQIIFSVIIFLMAAQSGMAGGLQRRHGNRIREKTAGKEIDDGTIHADF